MKIQDLNDYEKELQEAVLADCDRFCSCCSKVVKRNEDDKFICPDCHSDDLEYYQNHLTSWDWEDFLEDEVKEKLKEIDTEEAYAEFLDEIYGEIDICGMKYNAGEALKDLDPVSYRCGHADHVSFEAGENRWCEIDGEYYYTEEVLDLFGVSA